MPDPNPPVPRRIFFALLQLGAILAIAYGGFLLFSAFGEQVDDRQLHHWERLGRSVASFFGVFGLLGGAGYLILWIWRTATALAPEVVREFPRRILDDGPAKLALAVAAAVALASSIVVKADDLQRDLGSLSSLVGDLVVAVDRAERSQTELARALEVVDPSRLDLAPILEAIERTNGDALAASVELRRELAGVRSAMGAVSTELDETQAGLRDAKDAVAALDERIDAAVEVADALPQVEELVTDLQEIAVYEHRRSFGQRLRDIWNGAPDDEFPVLTPTETTGEAPTRVASSPDPEVTP